MAKFLNVCVFSVVALFSFSATAMQEDASARLVRFIKRPGRGCIIESGAAMTDSDLMFPGEAGRRHVVMSYGMNRMNIEVYAPSDRSIDRSLGLKHYWVLQLKQGLFPELILSLGGIVHASRILGHKEVLTVLIDRDGTVKFMKSSDEL